MAGAKFCQCVPKRLERQVTEVLTALMLGLCFEASCPIIITKEEAKALGWKSKQANLAEVAPRENAWGKYISK